MTSDQSAKLDARLRRRHLEKLADRSTGHQDVDVLVIGGGVTGVGIALDAATRGLRTVLVDAHDLAFGTSRWSSKLVHGGLRYLASGRLGVAHESAVERGILMTRTAPHLIHAMTQVVPLMPSITPSHRLLVRTGFLAGDTLRVVARTPGSVLPRSRKVNAAKTIELVPGVRTDGLKGGLLAFDGQLVDDARLVVTIARTAAEHGASILNHVRADEVTGSSARLTDTTTGETFTLAAKAVINATGVWAAEVDSSIKLRPSRGTHLVFDAELFGNPTGALTVPVPGSISRFIFALPQQQGRIYLGLTDEDAPGPIPDEPQAADSEIDFLLDTVNTALQVPVTRNDIRGTYSGLRPLLDSGGGETSDVSRKHAVLESPNGLITIVGGKLTTYRRMAQDAVDKAVDVRGLQASDCKTHNLPLIGAPGHAASTATAGLPESLVARFGGAARTVLDAATVAMPLEPIADGVDVTRAEIEFAITNEGAVDASDVLDRRTRIGLVASDADRARPAVQEILDAVST